jgi:hypothetical protein
MTVLSRTSSNLGVSSQIRCSMSHETKKWAMGPAGPETRNDCAGEALQQFTGRTDMRSKMWFILFHEAISNYNI